MGRQKGQAKTGGRKPGTPNKTNSDTTAKVSELCHAYGFDPLESMILLAKSDDLELPYKIALLKELAQYVYPKRKSIEMTADVNGEVSSVIHIVLPDNGTSSN